MIAARATPPRIPANGSTSIDALVAHEGGRVTVESPMTAEVASTSAAMARYLEQDGDTWRLHAPDAETLASARPALGLPEDAPVPVDVMLTFSSASAGASRSALPPFRVKKTVWLGEPSNNPEVPPVFVDDVRAGQEIVVPIGIDTYVAVEVADGVRVNWLTNVGSLFQDDVARAFVRVLPEDRHDGELVVVLRDNDGGVAWHVFPMRAE